MYISPNPLPTVPLAHEAPRPQPQQTQEISRPVVAPTPSEHMAQELPRDTGSRTAANTDRKLEHEPSSAQRPRRSSAHATADHSAASPGGSATAHPNNPLTVGSLLDVFA